ncbi:TPA: rhodanese-like domain-containing protein, partial [Raoultella planticola]
MSVVTAFTPAACADAAAWFRHKLSFETDCADVYSAMRDGACDFVLL